MAEIVCVAASTHNPRIFWNRDQASPEDMNELYATFDGVARQLADARPDVIVTIANDHFDSYFFDNLPTFSIGVGALAHGPYWYETEIMNLPHYTAPIAQDIAKHILRDGIESGMPFRKRATCTSIMPLRCRSRFCARKPICRSCRSSPMPSAIRWPARCAGTNSVCI